MKLGTIISTISSCLFSNIIIRGGGRGGGEVLPGGKKLGLPRSSDFAPPNRRSGTAELGGAPRDRFKGNPVENRGTRSTCVDVEVVTSHPKTANLKQTT